MDFLISLLIISIAVNMLMFLIAFFLKTDKLTDISYAVTFVILAIYGLFISQFTLPAILLALMIAAWAGRLGGYLLVRIRKIGRDKRFDGRREKFWSFAAFWLIQAVTVWVVMLPSSIFFSNKPTVISVFSVIGILIWLTGLAIEAVADYQKYVFINDASNKGKWIEQGLWKYSRHPNYFGEILLWSGVYIFTLVSLNLTQGLVGLIGPLYIATLIIFVSGIPILEKAADKRWGADEKYQEYKRKTSVLVILP